MGGLGGGGRRAVTITELRDRDSADSRKAAATSAPFRIASIPATMVISGAVSYGLTTPPAVTASDVAAALTLSSASMMSIRSYLPKARYAVSKRVPTFLCRRDT
jgi:hypothetical protein